MSDRDAAVRPGNLRTALVLALIAGAFFIGIMLKYLALK